MIAAIKPSFHEFIDLFPAMGPEEREQLKQDIQDHGVQTPVVVYQGQIADGRHRVEIATELGINYPTIDFEGTEHELLLHLLSLNFHRRHLTAGQRAAVVAHYQLLSRGLGGDERKPGRRPKGEPARGKTPDGKQKRELEEVAEKADVGKTSLWRAETVAEKRPDLLKEVIAGNTTLSQAHSEVVDPKPKKKTASQKITEPDPDDPQQDDGEHGEDEAPEPELGEQRDCLGHLVPADLIPVFSELDLFAEAEKHLAAAKRAIKEVCETGAGVRVDKPAIMADVKNAVKELKAKKPYTVCPKCQGDGCHQCEHCGWISQSLFELLPESERQEWIDLGKQDMSLSDPSEF